MNFLLYLFAACALFQIAYQWVLMASIIKHKQAEKKTEENLPSVSVVICAKNETANLHKNLPSILAQHYSDFEIIVVDDGSEDAFAMKVEYLRIIRLSKEEKIGKGKKYALRKGLEAAKNEFILLTDADCQPMSENWIREMADEANYDKKIVLGISPYKYENTFLNALIEYETAQTAMQYIGFALLGNPYMSVGRNVLYKRELLLQKQWTPEELSIASGDDDLTIQSLATAENTTVCLSKDSYTTSEAKSSWKEFIHQKLRHYESGNLYKLSHRLLLGSYLLSKSMFYLLFILLLFKNTIGSVILLFFYETMITGINFSLHKKTGLNKRWLFSFLNDVLYCIFTITLGGLSQFKTVKHWK